MPDIQQIAVLGSGTMGLGIAHVAALAGYETCLFDVSAEALARAEKTIHSNLDKGVARGKVATDDAAAAKARIDLATDLATAVATTDLVIEAIPESLPLKIDVFERVVAACPAHALLTSNTSGLSITEMAAATDRPERFAGMHFFNPVHIMRLIELVRGRETSESTLELLRTVGARMGKEMVTVNESPGFVTSRINALIGNEAFRMLEAGIASPEDIDKALKLGLNHPMGPFEMVDLVGLDIRLSILEFLHGTLGETYRPTEVMRRYVADGRLGRKTGRGVYRYDENGRRLEESAQ
jgi:3-hydroxybutyryl-CoA dehydrogenase